MGWERVDRICLAEDRDQWQVLGELHNEPSNAVKCGEFVK
jgi:hypothetical protein